MAICKESRTVLGEKYAVDILVALLDHEPSMATDFLPMISNYNSVVKVGRMLEDAGLIKIKIETGRRTVHRYSLTEKGHKVAEKLRDAQGYIENFSREY